MKKLFLAASIESTAPALAQYIDKPPQSTRLLFIPTAAEGEKGDKQWLEDDRNGLAQQGYQMIEFTITDKTEREVREVAEGVDVVFVNGGNMFYLLKQARQCNLRAVVEELLARGGIYGGSSAGSIIAGPDTYPAYKIESMEKVKDLDSYEGMGLVDFTILPHWGSPLFRDLYLNRRLEHAYTTKNKLILLADKQYVWVENGWYQIKEM